MQIKVSFKNQVNLKVARICNHKLVIDVPSQACRKKEKTADSLDHSLSVYKYVRIQPV